MDSNPPVDLSGSSKDLDVTLADVTGHGTVDLLEVQRTAGVGRTLLFRNQHEPGRISSKTGFGPAELSSAPADVSLSGPNIRLVDLNFDKKTDILVSTANGLDGYVWTDAGWKPFMRRWLWSQQLGDGGIPPQFHFSYVDQNGQEQPNPLVQVADMNGDRLLDLVRVTVSVDNEVRISYLPMIGPMQWGKEITLEFARADGSSSGIPGRFPMVGVIADANNRSNRWQSIKFIDVNGDGLTDLVFVRENRIAEVYLNCAGKALRGPFPVAFQSDYHPGDALNPTVLRTADLNGNGSVDLVFFHRTGRLLSYLDFTSGQKAGLLQVVDNGIGKRSYLRYHPSTSDLVRARSQNAPWSTTNPNPMWVLSALIEADGPEAASAPGASFRVTTFDYRDGYYDPYEKQFRGYAFVQQIVWGDDLDTTTGLPSAAPLGSPGSRTAVSRFRFHTGAPDGVDNDEYLPGLDVGTSPSSAIDEATELAGREEEPLKGRLIWKELADGSVLTDPRADFDKCAANVAREIRSGNGYGPAASSCSPDRYVLSRTIRAGRYAAYTDPQGRHGQKRFLRSEPTSSTLNGRSVSVAVKLHHSEQSIEAIDLLRSAFPTTAGTLPPSLPVTVGMALDYDDFGNTTVMQEKGIPGASSTSRGANRVTRKSYILTRGNSGSIDRWILDRQSGERVEGPTGDFASEVRYLYDGPDFKGLPLGELGSRALLSRVQRRLHDASVPLVAFPDSADH